jgi:hypothetical protein
MLHQLRAFPAPLPTSSVERARALHLQRQVRAEVRRTCAENRCLLARSRENVLSAQAAIARSRALLHHAVVELPPANPE